MLIGLLQADKALGLPEREMEDEPDSCLIQRVAAMLVERYPTVVREDQRAISDPIVGYDPGTLVRRPVRKARVVARFEKAGNSK